ncbi:unnamed protein product [marine sediment metagenome]|uniref:Uncharacterized protein n=1 Tax=marine sediment metagenome TaxID=412755 RepID=X1CNZ7_9ZZZZ
MDVLNIYHKDRRKQRTLIGKLKCASNLDCKRMKAVLREVIRECGYKNTDMEWEIK